MGASLHSLIPPLQPFARRLLLPAGQAGLQPRITSTRRSRSEQTKLYRRFLQGTNPYPVAPPGQSAHEFGYAFDMMIQGTPLQMKIGLDDLGYLWQTWGGVWGGQFNDPIHFEFPGFPHAAVESAGQSGYVKAANIAASFLPGGAGLLASVSPAFAGGKSKCPWWDPFGYITNQPECRG